MFCILLANLRKQVKIHYNLLSVNEDFEGKRNAKIHFLVIFFISRYLYFKVPLFAASIIAWLA